MSWRGIGRIFRVQHMMAVHTKRGGDTVGLSRLNRKNAIMVITTQFKTQGFDWLDYVER